MFDPAAVEDILDRNLVDHWREEDAERAAERRRLTAWKRRLAREETRGAAPPSPSSEDIEGQRFKLRGWDEFEREGLLR